ncbi:MAG TPA: mandelate racemase/muconate lactonizing enzyme family protein [Xanthobacteraceae bacterium]|nr:mandelate racemase/muconate lactonizing enzyme family protein [Xanthobacteraceae bacterium]
MKIVSAEVVRPKPIALPSPWRPAWMEPDLVPVTTFDCSFYRLRTDDGITGIGPFTGASPDLVKGIDPTHIEAFFTEHMSGKRFRSANKGASGLELALWDIVGKAAGLPVYRLLGCYRDRLPVYAATTRLLSAKEHVAQAIELHKQGFKAIKFRMHRPTADEDLAVLEAVHEAVGGKVALMVDANQNAPSRSYAHWDKRTAHRVARRLEEMNFAFLEEPLPHTDVDGLVHLAEKFDVPIAGGEGIPTVYDYAPHIDRRAYDIIQPDVFLGGNYGITGLRKLAFLAEHRGIDIMPHVTTGGLFSINLAATLQAMATVPNCPMVEYCYDPPLLTSETQQPLVKNPLWIDADGCVKVPNLPGLGFELNEEWIAARI